jgi:hypothetical protein
LQTLRRLVALSFGVALLAACRWVGRREPPDDLFVLVVREDARTPDAGPRSGAGAEALALRAMSTREQSALTTSLRDLADVAELRHNPLAQDLEDRDPDALTRAISRSLLPALSAAGELLPGSWRASDGLGVDVAHSCPAGATCISPWNVSDDRRDERARYLAWPLAYGVVVRAPPGETPSLARCLRDGLGGDESGVALIVDDASLVERTTNPVSADAHRLSTSMPASARGRDIVERLAVAPEVAPVAPWLVLHDHVLVVPKMGALAQEEVFIRAVGEGVERCGLAGASVVRARRR